jgi:hypothetical protein
MRKFTNTGKSRETSKEIMEAISFLATSYEEAERIWATPTPEELIAIWERVTKNGLKEPEAYRWGDAGTRWADEIS